MKLCVNLLQPGIQGSPTYSNTQGNTTSASSSETDSTFSAPSPPRVNGTLTINPTAGITIPPSPSETSSSFASPSPSGGDGRHAMNPAVPDVPPIESSSEDFDPQGVFGQDEIRQINFEQDFREWFSPEPVPTNLRFSVPLPPGVNGTRLVSRSETSSSFTSPLPSGVNGRHAMNPAVQPTSTSLPEVRSNFMSNDFMQSVASTLEDFDPQVLFRQDDASINFEQNFREWFSPEDMEGMRNG